MDRSKVLPQIFLCSSDLISVGLMAALKERGYHIPRDIGVVGFDDISISAFADPNNYPMNFHCAVGRDRTGTTAFLILGLLGVDEETLIREYYSSFFSSTTGVVTIFGVSLIFSALSLSAE